MNSRSYRMGKVKRTRKAGAGTRKVGARKTATRKVGARKGAKRRARRS